MKIIDVQQGSDEWKELRKKRIGGTRLGDVWSARAYTKKEIVAALTEAGVEFKKTATTTELEQMMPDDARMELLKNAPRKQGFYELIAEYLSIDRSDMTPRERMDRGHELEPLAREWFAKTYNKNVEEIGMCCSDAADRIYNSPDGLIRKSPKSKKYTEALEIKCLSPARHIQAVIEKKVPEEYWSQMMQYFVVNEDLEKLWWVFHDPGIVTIPYFVLEITRDSLGDWPKRLLEFQIAQLKRIDEIIEELAF
jgi:hypothetical protein